MSKTPLTDAAEYTVEVDGIDECGMHLTREKRVVCADFARELERELAAANARVAELEVARVLTLSLALSILKKCFGMRRRKGVARDRHTFYRRGQLDRRGWCTSDPSRRRADT